MRVIVRPERFVDLAVDPNAVRANRIDGRVTDSAYIGESDKYRRRDGGGHRRPDAAAVGAEPPPLSRRRADRRGFHAADARLIAVQ